MNPPTTLSFFRNNLPRLIKNFEFSLEVLSPLNPKFFAHDLNCPSTPHLIASLVQKESKLLDVGCSWGGACAYLDPSVEYHGVDFCPQMLDSAIKKPNCFYYLEDFHLLPFKDNFFDYVLANESLFYGNVDIAHREIFRVLKPNGTFFSKMWLYDSIPDETSIPESIYICSGIEHQDPNVFGIRNRKDYISKLDTYFNHSVLTPSCLIPGNLFKYLDYVYCALPEKVSEENPFKHSNFTPEDRKILRKDLLKTFGNLHGMQDTIGWSSEGFFVCSKK